MVSAHFTCHSWWQSETMGFKGYYGSFSITFTSQPALSQNTYSSKGNTPILISVLSSFWTQCSKPEAIEEDGCLKHIKLVAGYITLTFLLCTFVDTICCLRPEFAWVEIEQ